MSSKKDCMFQYIVTTGHIYAEYEIIKDTGLITRKEADRLWHEYRDDFIKRLNSEWSRPEMEIWINCKDNTDYHTSTMHLDEDTKYDGRRFFKEVKQYVDEKIT